SLSFPLTLVVGQHVLANAGGWRLLLAIGALAGAVVFLLRLSLPESPRWLAANGATAKAELIVAKVEDSAGTPLPQVALPALIETERARIGICAIAPGFATAAAINIAAIGAVYGFVSWLPTFFVAAGRDVATSTAFSAVMTLGAPVGA